MEEIQADSSAADAGMCEAMTRYQHETLKPSPMPSQLIASPRSCCIRW